LSPTPTYFISLLLLPLSVVSWLVGWYDDVEKKDVCALTERHVMWARKQNLYNGTFNTESRADVLWSYRSSHQTYSARWDMPCVSIHQPLMTVARHYLVIPSSVLSLVDPTTGSCDVSPVPLYQWRQIRDHTLRIDDGRDGLPNMVLSFDSQRPSQIFVRR